MKTTLYWILLVVIILTACHKRTEVAPDYNSVSRMVGPEGKKLDIFLSNGTSRVVTIDIPPDALDKEVEIGVSLKIGYPGLVILDSLFCYSAAEYGEYWEFIPRGLTFKKPVKINLTSMTPDIKFFTLVNPNGDNLNPDNWERKQDYTFSSNEAYLYQFTDTVFTSYFIPLDYNADFYINGAKYNYTKEGPFFENGYYYVLYKHDDEVTQLIFAEPPLTNKKYHLYNSYENGFLPADQVDYCMIRQYDDCNGNQCAEEYWSISGEIMYRSWFNEFGSQSYAILSNNVLIKSIDSDKEKRIMGYSTY